MKKVSITLLVLIVLVTLFAITIAVQAGPPESASGLWLYTPYLVDVRVAGCDTHLTTIEVSEWKNGTFVGNSTEDARVIIHCAGNWSYKGTVDFQYVEVNGRSGTLRMSVNGSRPDAETDWTGHWVITGGGGELENLRGQGKFWGPGAPAPEEQGEIYYDGNIHFESN